MLSYMNSVEGSGFHTTDLPDTNRKADCQFLFWHLSEIVAIKYVVHKWALLYRYM